MAATRKRPSDHFVFTTNVIFLPAFVVGTNFVEMYTQKDTSWTQLIWIWDPTKIVSCRKIFFAVGHSAIFNNESTLVRNHSQLLWVAQRKKWNRLEKYFFNALEFGFAENFEAKHFLFELNTKNCEIQINYYSAYSCTCVMWCSVNCVSDTIFKY